MTDPFHSPKRRLARAHEHVSAVKTGLLQFMSGVPHTHFTEPDGNTGFVLHKVKLAEPIPAEFADRTVEAIEGFRSALDQVVFAASGKGTVKNAYFPIADSAAELENVIKGRCKDVPADLVSYLRLLRPFKGGGHAIWALNKLCNSGKHKFLAPVGFASGGMHVHHLATSGVPVELFAPVWDTVKEEMTILRTGSSGGNLDYNIDIAFNIVFGDVDGARGEDVIGTIEAIASNVDKIVSGIISESERLKLV